MDITRRVKQSLHLSALSSTQGLLSYSKYFARCSGMVMIGIKILAPAARPFSRPSLSNACNAVVAAIFTSFKNNRVNAIILRPN